MVAIQLPTPRLGHTGLAHDGDPVEPFTIFIKALGQLGQRAVELHDILRLLETASAEAGTQQIKDEFTLALRHFVKADTLTHIEMAVIPLAPLDIVHWKNGLLSIFLAKAG